MSSPEKYIIEREWGTKRMVLWVEESGVFLENTDFSMREILNLTTKPAED